MNYPWINQIHPSWALIYSTILYSESSYISCIFILYPVSSILYPVSCILYPVSCIQYPVSCILYPVSSILVSCKVAKTNKLLGSCSKVSFKLQPCHSSQFISSWEIIRWDKTWNLLSHTNGRKVYPRLA